MQWYEITPGSGMEVGRHEGLLSGMTNCVVRTDLILYLVDRVREGNNTLRKEGIYGNLC